MIQIGFELYHGFLENFGNQENVHERSLKFGSETKVTSRREDMIRDAKWSLDD